MFIVGLTGGIASGKTAASDFFAEKDICVVDADVVAREVVAPGSRALLAIVEHFGPEVLEGNVLNRRYLRERVFANPEQKEWLNALLHPAIRERMLSLTNEATSPYVVWAVPLLIENGIYKSVDKVLVIDAPEHMQILRAIKRDNCSEETIKKIMDAQADRKTRVELADYVVVNDNSIDELKTNLQELHELF